MNWLLVIDSLLSISTFLVFSGTFEFIYAQAPYSMRGFLFSFEIILYGSSYTVTNFTNKFASSIKNTYTQTDSKESYCSIYYLVILVVFQCNSTEEVL